MLYMKNTEEIVPPSWSSGLHDEVRNINVKWLIITSWPQMHRDPYFQHAHYSLFPMNNIYDVSGLKCYLLFLRNLHGFSHLDELIYAYIVTCRSNI